MQEMLREEGSILCWEDPLEKGMATDSSILAWRISWTEKPGGLVHVITKSRTQLKQLSIHAGHGFATVPPFLATVLLRLSLWY